MSVDHRRTAAIWSGDAGAPLDHYARSGTVAKGLVEEVRHCLAIVEGGELDVEFDPVDEYQRLTALLHHVEPQWAMQRADAAGGRHGAGAAEWWAEPLVGGRVGAAEAKATAQRLLQGIEDGDPAVLDEAPDGDHVAALAEIFSESGWQEPDRDDPAHRRWAAAQADVLDAYVTAYVETFWDTVADACRRELEPASVVPSAESRRRQPVGSGRPTRDPSAHGATERRRSPEAGDVRWPFLRSVSNDRPLDRVGPVPDGWTVERIGLWGHDDAEVVFDPRRHDVLLTWSTPADDVAAGLKTSGWEQRGEAGGRTFWVRDPVAATRAALARVDREAERDRTLSVRRSDETPARPRAAELDRGVAL